MSTETKLTALVLAMAVTCFPAIAQTKRPVSNSGAQKAAPVAVSNACPIPRTENQQVYRVYMKDGSYQPVTQCELLDGGQRVHYKSAERGEFEDVPNSMVDWAMTAKIAKEGPPTEKAEASPDAAQVDKEEAEERAAEEARSPEIKPGLRLPDQGGVFVLDYWRDEPQLVELVQNGSDINKNMGRNILRAAINPLAKSKQTIELKGSNARVQSHVPQPAIYVNVDQDHDPKTGPKAADESQHYRIVKVEQRKDSRVVGAIEIAVYGKVSQKANYIETKAAPISADWVKVTPAQPLEPGEYALVEMLGKDVNLYVWDFGVHPAAPQNDKAWRPAPVTDTTTGTKESPVLNKPPK